MQLKHSSEHPVDVNVDADVNTNSSNVTSTSTCTYCNSIDIFTIIWGAAAKSRRSVVFFYYFRCRNKKALQCSIQHAMIPLYITVPKGKQQIFELVNAEQQGRKEATIRTQHPCLAPFPSWRQCSLHETNVITQATSPPILCKWSDRRCSRYQTLAHPLSLDHSFPLPLSVHFKFLQRPTEVFFFYLLLFASSDPLDNCSPLHHRRPNRLRSTSHFFP